MAKTKRQNLEHTAQCAVIKWSRLARHEFSDLSKLFAVPNAARRNPAQAGWLKDEGMRAGVLDLYLLVARGGWLGFAAELKIRPNKCTPEQEQEIKNLRNDGYWAVVCYSSEEAIAEIKTYLRNAKTQIQIEPAP